jgi:hypothetical protein
MLSLSYAIKAHFLPTSAHPPSLYTTLQVHLHKKLKEGDPPNFNPTIPLVSLSMSTCMYVTSSMPPSSLPTSRRFLVDIRDFKYKNRDRKNKKGSEIPCSTITGRKGTGGDDDEGRPSQRLALYEERRGELRVSWHETRSSGSIII